MQGPLIRAVPEQRAEAQEAFTVETSWLSVADVSFADMLQIVDVAAKKNPTPSRLSKASSDGEPQPLTVAHSETLHEKTVTSPQYYCRGCYKGTHPAQVLRAVSFLVKITPAADPP